MSKLSPSLKALVNAPFARPGPAPAPTQIRQVYQDIAREAKERSFGRRPWLTLSAAATFTLNSPDSLHVLHQVATTAPATETPVAAAEFIREVGLKCISFNGIPRTINCLGAFRAGLPADVAAQLTTHPTRQITEANLGPSSKRGRALWDSVYTPFENKLYDKLAESHPDLPVHILGSHYGPLLSNPDERGRLATVGRSLTSILAIACLRSQTGVGPQVLSHVFGLRKAVEQGAHQAEFEAAEEVDAVVRLASEEGSEWILNSLDRISEAIGPNFAQGRESKL
ncbi:hypothetical protein GQ53DRAFT_754127 [Thozetella sp. PMI_491]|nr:hypothetical protein GQ53DRAFT_754127 [Thozetella sp. PMI_491]